MPYRKWSVYVKMPLNVRSIQAVGLHGTRERIELNFFFRSTLGYGNALVHLILVCSVKTMSQLRIRYIARPR